MRVLALDIGARRTGVAFYSSVTGIPLPLATIHHQSFDALSLEVHALIAERKISEIVVGLPLLPSGVEGEQAAFVRMCVQTLQIPKDVKIHFLDERYTTPQGASVTDPDAEAACHLLATHIGRQSV